MKWIVVYKDGQLKQLRGGGKMQREWKKPYRYFTWANFFTFQEIKTSKILTQLTKPQLFTRKQL